MIIKNSLNLFPYIFTSQNKKLLELIFWVDNTPPFEVSETNSQYVSGTRIKQR